MYHLKFKPNLLGKMLTAFAVCFCFFTVAAFAQGVEDTVASGDIILKSVMGVIAYYFQKALAAMGSGKWDWAYWRKDNLLPLIITLVVVVLISLFGGSNGDLIQQLLSLIGVQIDLGGIGTVAFGMSVATVLNAFIGKLFQGKGVKTTNGKGQPIEA